MQGKRIFTAMEADLIRSLINEKITASPNEQKRIRKRIRNI